MHDQRTCFDPVCRACARIDGIQACVDFIVSLCYDPRCTYGDRCRTCLITVREFLDSIGMPPCPDPECYACRRMN